MPMQPARSGSSQGRIYDAIRGEIAGGALPLGTRLPTVRELAQRFGVSVFPVQRALAQLQTEGYLEARRKAGTFVRDVRLPATIAETVAVLMQTRGHLYADLFALLNAKLLQRGLMPAVVGDSVSTEAELLWRLARSEAKVFLIHGREYLDCAAFNTPGFQRKTLVGILDWHSATWDGLHLVLADHRAGARLVADHLWNAGHRRVLMAATEMRHLLADHPHAPRGALAGQQGHCFARLWQAKGGTIFPYETGIEAHPDHMQQLDHNQLRTIFAQAEHAPTAVFGLQDVIAFRVQQALWEIRPGLRGKVEFIGYYNTPWSEAGNPAFSTVDLDLESVAEETCRVIDAVCTGKNVPAQRLVRPRLVLRGTATQRG